MLDSRGEVINVGGSDVGHDAILQERDAIAADGIAANLQEESLYCPGIEFLWRQTDDLAQTAAD